MMMPTSSRTAAKMRLMIWKKILSMMMIWSMIWTMSAVLCIHDRIVRRKGKRTYIVITIFNRIKLKRFSFRQSFFHIAACTFIHVNVKHTSGCKRTNIGHKMHKDV